MLDGQLMQRISGATDGSSFVSLMVLEGGGVACAGEERVPFLKGDSLFITADTGKYKMEGHFEALLTTV